MSWLRALAAGGLSVVFPGAGHALIRDWARALVFAGLYLSAVVIFLPTDQIAAAESMAESMELVAEGTDTVGQFALSFIVLFAAIDAAFRSLGFPPDSDAATDGPTCPECGKELDEDLEFCHWCTTRLDSAEGDDVDDDETVGTRSD